MTATLDTLLINAELARSTAIATGLEAQRADRVHAAALLAARAVARARALAWSTHAPTETADELETAFHDTFRSLAAAYNVAATAALAHERARLAYVTASVTTLEAGWADDGNDGTVQVGPTERIRR